MTLSISKGSDWTYVAHQVGQGTENYYTASVDTGEPAGQWRGAAAPGLGLEGQVSDLQLEALYGEKINPLDPNFLNRENWDQAERLGRRAGRYKTADDHLAALIDAEPDPANIEPERLEELQFQAEKKVQEARDFFDLTYAPPKSVSVAYTAFMAQEAAALGAGEHAEADEWAAKAKAVEQAVWDASGEMIKFMEREAGYSRAGYHGGKLKDGSTSGRFIDAHEFTVASFLQHTSRPVSGVEAPHLHVHNLVLNKVECADGVWRTLDAKALYAWRGGAGAVADRAMMAQLTRELGVEWEYDPKSKSHEIVGVSRDVRDLLSPRRAAINGLLPTYVEAFKQRMGRDPHALELSELAQRATIHSRERKLSKSQAKTLEAKVQVWTEQVRTAVDESLTVVAEGITSDPNSMEGRAFDPDKVIAQGIASVQDSRAYWRKSDLMAHMQRYMPGVLAGLDVEYQTAILSELADRAVAPDPVKYGEPDEILPLTAPELVAVPAEFRLRNGSSAYKRQGAELYATRALMEDEAQLESTAATDLGAVRIAVERADAAINAVNERLAAADPSGRARLGSDQEAAITGILTSGNRSEVLIGPAGTGKSFVLGNLAEIWEHETGGRVYGLATAQNAANVLKDEGIRNTANIEGWLKKQEQIDAGELRGSERSRWKLRAHDIVFIDEASMADTRKLAEIERRVSEAGAKVVKVGDDRQLGAIGPGGALRLSVEAGSTYKLSEVRRFNQPWERDASLRLRDGDESVIREYDARQRIIRCDSLQDAQEKAARAYIADVLAGSRAYLEVDTNEQAFDVANRVRNELVRYGKVSPEGVRIGQDRHYTVAGVGDTIAARRNRARIKDANGNSLTNRNLYKVVETHERGDLTVRAVGGTGELGAPMTIPARYAQEHVSLAYAMTQHGVQGKTGDTSRAIIGPNTSAEAAYVGLTRGRETNVAYVYDQIEHTSTTAEPRPATTILTEVITRDSADVSATQMLRDNLDDAGSMRVIGARLVDANEKLVEHRYDALVTAVAPTIAARVLTDDAKTTLYRTLDAAEAAGQDPEAVLREAIAERELGSAQSIAKVLHYRIKDTLDVSDGTSQPLPSDPTGDTYTERLRPGSGDLHRYATEYAELADARARDLGQIQANRPAPWALAHLGPVPADPLNRDDWATKAGRIAAYREAYNISGDDQPIGRAPSPYNHQRHGEWHSAWRALGRPDQTRPEQTMTPAQLQNAIDAYEAEKVWAPPAVSTELRETSKALAEAKERAALAEAEARTLDTEADQRRAELFTEAAEALNQADELEQRRAKLEQVHQTRGMWRLATTQQRDAAEAATRELARRAADTAERETTQDKTTQEPADADQKPQQTRDRGTDHSAEHTNDREPPTVDQDQKQTADQDHTVEKHQRPVPASAAFPTPTTGRQPIDVDKAVLAAEAAAEKLAAQAQQRDANQAAQQQAQADEEHRAREAAEAARKASERQRGPDLGR